MSNVASGQKVSSHDSLVVAKKEVELFLKTLETNLKIWLYERKNKDKFQTAANFFNNYENSLLKIQQSISEKVRYKNYTILQKIFVDFEKSAITLDDAVMQVMFYNCESTITANKITALLKEVFIQSKNSVVDVLNTPEKYDDPQIFIMAEVFLESDFKDLTNDVLALLQKI
jgi:hypothetical protein